MAIFKEDWGVNRVKKELDALMKTRDKYRKSLGNYFKRLGPEQMRILDNYNRSILEKKCQLEQAKYNWELWEIDEDWKIAIAEMINSIAQSGIRFEG